MKPCWLSPAVSLWELLSGQIQDFRRHFTWCKRAEKGVMSHTTPLVHALFLPWKVFCCQFLQWTWYCQHLFGMCMTGRTGVTTYIVLRKLPSHLRILPWYAAWKNETKFSRGARWAISKQTALKGWKTAQVSVKCSGPLAAEDIHSTKMIASSWQEETGQCAQVSSGLIPIFLNLTNFLAWYWLKFN